MTIMPALPPKSPVYWDDVDAVTKAYIKRECERSGLFFTRMFFKDRRGNPFHVNAHHEVIDRTLERVITGEINRLIISVPPGYTKTEMAVISFIARGLALTKGKGQFIHASYSGSLVNENSDGVKDTVMSLPYSEMWGYQPRADKKAKGLWRVDEGGGLLAQPAGGTITGFRAGTMEPGFTGALVIDDPLKPDDIWTKKRDLINGRWHSTFASRLAHQGVPVIVIMQRLHTDDFAGYLLKGGANCHWHHLMLPVLIDSAEEYPMEFTHGIPIEHGLPDGPLWEAKHNAEQIEILKGDNYTFQAQYIQRPMLAGGSLFKEEHLVSYTLGDVVMEWRGIWADTAQKVEQKNDWSVFQCWGRGAQDGKAYLIDQARGKWEAPELLEIGHAFWLKHANVQQYPSNRYGVLRSMNVEDKVSGTGLIQQLARRGVPVQPVERGVEKNKFTRALDVLPSFATDQVRLPRHEDAPWRGNFDTEVLTFTGNGDGFDDQVDPMLDAVKEICTGFVPYSAW